MSALGQKQTFATFVLFTPLFTPARFLALFWTQDFQKITVPQAQMQFAADCCPLYPQKRTFAEH
jgi:hypothetical protein